MNTDEWKSLMDAISSSAAAFVAVKAAADKARAKGEEPQSERGAHEEHSVPEPVAANRAAGGAAGQLSHIFDNIAGIEERNVRDIATLAEDLWRLQEEVARLRREVAGLRGMVAGTH